MGGTNVKILATGQTEVRKFPSGPEMTAEAMVSGVKKSLPRIGNMTSYRLATRGRFSRAADFGTHNLGSGWVGFDFGKAFGCPVKLVNDASMQALGSYKGGIMLFLGLGTGLGSALIVDGILEPMELGHLPYKKGTYEDYVGLRGLEKEGKEEMAERCGRRGGPVDGCT